MRQALVGCLVVLACLSAQSTTVTAGGAAVKRRNGNRNLRPTSAGLRARLSKEIIADNVQALHSLTLLEPYREAYTTATASANAVDELHCQCGS